MFIRSRRSAVLSALVLILSASKIPAQTSAPLADPSAGDDAAIRQVIQSFENSVAALDFDRADSFITPDARWIEDSYPWPLHQWPQFLRAAKPAGMRIQFRIRDMDVRVHGDAAWVTLTLASSFQAPTPAARALLGNADEWHPTFVESETLVRTPDGWKIALGHTTRLPDPQPDKSGVPPVSTLRPGILPGWRPLAPMPTARAWAFAAPLQGKILLLNGISGWGKHAHWVTAAELYDPSADHWLTVTPPPASNNQFVPALVDGSLVLFAGSDEPTGYRYSLDTDAWQPQPGLQLPWTAQDNMAATGVVSVAGRLFALIGKWEKATKTWIDSFVEYDPAHSAWIPRSAPSQTERGPQMVVVNNRLFFIGVGEQVAAVQEYDLARDTWINRAPLPTGRVEVRAAALNGKIYAIGGHVRKVGTTLAVADVYDPATDTWQSLHPLPEPRWGTAVAALDGKLYVFGGSSDSVGDTPASPMVWSLSPSPETQP